MQLYMECANKNRASPITKAAMREMLQIIKADERPTGKKNSAGKSLGRVIVSLCSNRQRLALECN